MARVKSSEEDVYYRNLQRKVSVEGTPEVFVRGMLDVRFYEVKSHEEKRKQKRRWAEDICSRGEESFRQEISGTRLFVD